MKRDTNNMCGLQLQDKLATLRVIVHNNNRFKTLQMIKNIVSEYTFLSIAQLESEIYWKDEELSEIEVTISLKNKMSCDEFEGFFNKMFVTYIIQDDGQYTEFAHYNSTDLLKRAENDEYFAILRVPNRLME